jgi:hypothetical protein
MTLAKIPTSGDNSPPISNDEGTIIFIGEMPSAAAD